MRCLYSSQTTPLFFQWWQLPFVAASTLTKYLPQTDFCKIISLRYQPLSNTAVICNDAPITPAGRCVIVASMCIIFHQNMWHRVQSIYLWCASHHTPWGLSLSVTLPWCVNLCTGLLYTSQLRFCFRILQTTVKTACPEETNLAMLIPIQSCQLQFEIIMVLFFFFEWQGDTSQSN